MSATLAALHAAYRDITPSVAAARAAALQAEIDALVRRVRNERRRGKR